MSENFKGFLIFFLTLVLSSLAFAHYQDPDRLFSLFRSDEERIEKALISRDGFLYFKTDNIRSMEAFTFLESEVMKTVNQVAPEKAAQYQMIKSMQHQALSFEEHFSSTKSYGAFYFNKHTFVEGVIVYVGEFKPKETIQAIQKDVAMAPDVITQNINDHTIKITAKSKSTNGRTFPFSGIIDVHPNRIIIASESVYDKFLNRLNKPEDSRGKIIFNDTKNDIMYLNWDFQSTLGYFGFLFTMLQYENPEAIMELEALENISFATEYVNKPEKYLDFKISIKTSNPYYYQKTLDDFFGNINKYAQNEDEKRILMHLKQNLKYGQNQSEGKFDLSYKLDSKNIELITKESLRLAAEHEKRLLEQQKMLEQKVPNNEDNMIPMNPIEPNTPDERPMQEFYRSE